MCLKRVVNMFFEKSYMRLLLFFPPMIDLTNDLTVSLSLRRK